MCRWWSVGGLCWRALGSNDDENIVGAFFRLEGDSDSDLSGDESTPPDAHEAVVEPRNDGEAPDGAGVDAAVPTTTVFTSKGSHTCVRLVEEKRRGIGFQLWPAAEHLCEFIEAHVGEEGGLNAFGTGKVRVYWYCCTRAVTHPHSHREYRSLNKHWVIPHTLSPPGVEGSALHGARGRDRTCRHICS